MRASSRVTVFGLCVAVLLAACGPGLHGHVIDARGTPVSRVRVQLEAAGQDEDATPVASQLTDQDGAYDLQDPVTGNYTLRVRWQYDVACPGLESGIPLTRLGDQQFSFDTSKPLHEMQALKQLGYLHGLGAQVDFRLPCQRATPMPTLPPTSTPFPTETITPRPSHTPTATQLVCATREPSDDSLAGSSWTLVFDTGESFQVTLLPGGQLLIDATTLSECADWRVRQNVLTLRLRGNTILLQGLVLDGDRVEDASGQDLTSDTRWTWTAIRNP